MDLMRLLAALVLSLALVSCARLPAGVDGIPASPRELGGILSGKTELSGEVIVVSDLLIPSGSTLVIRPGTTLRIRSSEGTKIDPEYLSPATEILVRGALQVFGTSDRPVRFVPEEGKGGAEPAWAGIVFDRAAESALQHAEILGAETGILCINASPQLRGVRISGARYGLIAQEKSSPLVRESRIENGEGGVFCWRGAQPVLIANVIVGQQEEGIFIDAESRPRLEGNEITGNGIGIALYDVQRLPDRSQVRGNSEDVRLLGGKVTP